MFELGDVVEVVLEGSILRSYSEWHGLVGTVEKIISSRIFRVRFPHIVANEPHDDVYILQLRPKYLRLAHREPDWEV